MWFFINRFQRDPYSSAPTACKNSWWWSSWPNFARGDITAHLWRKWVEISACSWCFNIQDQNHRPTEIFHRCRHWKATDRGHIHNTRIIRWCYCAHSGENWTHWRPGHQQKTNYHNLERGVSVLMEESSSRNCIIVRQRSMWPLQSSRVV